MRPANHPETQIDDYFLITFYNFYGEVIYTLGTRVGTKTVRWRPVGPALHAHTCTSPHLLAARAHIHSKRRTNHTDARTHTCQPQAKKVLMVANNMPKSPAESQFAASDIIRVPGVDAIGLSRILGKQQAREFTISAAPGVKMPTKPYWWGVDPAVYYIYNAVDPLYYWKVAGLVLARNPRQGLSQELKDVLKELHFTSNGLETDKLTEDQKTALIASIPIGSQGLAQSFYMIGPKEHGYWYTTTCVPGCGASVCYGSPCV